MKKLFLILPFLFAAAAFAAPQSYKIAVEMDVDGKTISKPTIITMAGTKARVESNHPEKGGTFIEVTPSEGELGGVSGILMEMEVGKISPDGTKTVLSRPRLLSRDGGEARVMINDKGAKQEITIKAVATRVE